jgi:hypothetical protein
MTDNSNTTENTKTVTIPGSSNLRMILLSLVILTAGIIIGSAGTTLITRKNFAMHPKHGAGAAERMTRGLKKRLGLSDKQFKKIKPIIKMHMNKLSGIQDVARPLIEAEVSEMKEKISALLTDDQKERWERQIKRFEKGLRMHRGPGEGRGPGPGPHGPGGGRGMRPGGDGRGPGRRPDGPGGFGPGGEGRWPRRGPGGPRGMGPGEGMHRNEPPQNPDIQEPPTK